MRIRAALAAVVVATLGCEATPHEPSAPRVLSIVGAYDAEQWTDASVPGSETPRPGSNLPIYFVCPVDGDPAARAAAILSDARLRLFADGTAEIHLETGSWSRVGGAVTARSETVSRWGRWEDDSAGEITLSGFGIPGLGTTLQYTELNHAALPLTIACPGVSTTPSVQPTLSFTLGS